MSILRSTLLLCVALNFGMIIGCGDDSNPSSVVDDLSQSDIDAYKQRQKEIDAESAAGFAADPDTAGKQKKP